MAERWSATTKIDMRSLTDILDARMLIRSMLQPEPSQRITIENILTHAWFKRTIVDQMPEQPGEGNQPISMPNSPNPGGPHFDEPFDPERPSNPRHLSVPSPLHENPPSIPPPINEGSDQSHSETSLDLGDSEHGRADTNSTAPTTAEDSDEEPMKRVHSGEFSQTEKDLEMMHSNTSQSTIRRSGSESPTGTSSGVKNRVAIKTALEGQTEVDEDALGEEETSYGSVTMPHSSDHTLHPPVAQHSRTPSRTKRRSVSSTLSLERRHSHHSTSGQFTSWPPEDMLARLHETRAEPFSTPSEKHLLGQLSDIGFNTGQIVHSVTNDACDSSAAAWWMLRAKQTERGENDEVILARQSASQRRNERAAAYAREERKRAQKEREAGREPLTSTESGKSANVKFIDQAQVHRPPTAVSILEHTVPTPQNEDRPSFSMSPESLTPADVVNKVPQPSLLHPLGPPVEKSPSRTSQLEEPRKFPTPPHLHRLESLPVTAESSPVRDKERPTKSRSPSMSMLQRATSVLVPGAWKNEDKERDKSNDRTIIDEGDKKDKDGGRSLSPTKLTKVPPKFKMVKSESDNSLSRSLDHGHHQHPSPQALDTPPLQPEAGPSFQPLSTARTSSTLASEATAESTPSASPSKTRSSKRDAFWSWNSFRYMFNDQRRRRSRDEPGSPMHREVKSGPAVVLSRGISGRGPHLNRVALPLRHSSIDGRPGYSRRSSSVNSRRSSFNSGQVRESSHDALPTLGRRMSGRSHDSQTPTSEREYNPLSRPNSIHERDFAHLHHSSSRRASNAMRSPSMQSDSSGRNMRFATPASPLHNYQRRAPKGTDSRRVRHIRVIPENQMVRTESMASSIRSGASSRASSRERVGGREDSDYDTGRDDASIRSKRRSDHASLAQQIHRRGSPLALPSSFTQHRRHSLKPAPPKLPLRDVFQNKEDEWVSDDEDIYSGGLGQKGQQRHIEGNAPKWEPDARAMFPATREREYNGSAKKNHDNGRRHGRRGSSSSRSRKNSSDEEEVKKTLGGRPIPSPGGGGGGGGGGMIDERGAGKMDAEMHVSGQGRRRGIPSGRVTAPVIEEEEEEEE